MLNPEGLSGALIISWSGLCDLFASNAGYDLGYLVGFIVEQVLSAFILALATAGVGALAEKVLTVLRGIDWIADLAREAAAVLRVVGYWFEMLAKAGAGSSITKAVVGFVKDSKTALATLMDKYPGVDKVIKRLAETWQLSSTFAYQGFRLAQCRQKDEFRSCGTVCSIHKRKRRGRVRITRRRHSLQ